MRSHPLWRGFWLAAVLAASLVLMGFSDALAVFRLDRRAVAFAGAVTTGAFLGALPGRLRKSAGNTQCTSWPRCLRNFLCGLGLAISLALTGDSKILSAFLTGSAGAWGFGLTMLAAGVTTIRIAGRKKA